MVFIMSSRSIRVLWLTACLLLAGPYMHQFFSSDLVYVWPYLHGKVRGLTIEPFYRKQTDAAKEDQELYKLLALVDVLRVGRTREINVAIEKFSQVILSS